MSDDRKRCAWIGSDLMREYHDGEWGVPLHDDRKLFEFLVLEGMQAGLSWRTILHKREAFRRAFHSRMGAARRAVSARALSAAAASPSVS